MRTASKLKPRLIAVDLDGTLLERDGTPRARDVESLRALRVVGVPVTILTGRMYSGARRAAEAIGVSGPVGCVDGGHLVCGETHRTLRRDALEPAHAELVRESLAAGDASTFLFAHDHIVHDERGEPYLGYLRTWSPDTERVARALDAAHWRAGEGLSAVVAVGGEPDIRSAAGRIESGSAGATAVATFATHAMSGDVRLWGMIVRPAGTDKGTALRALAAHHGISVDETMVVGDWLNDVAMMRVAGHAYAMPHAPDALTEHATHVLATGHTVADAVAHAFGTTPR